MDVDVAIIGCGPAGLQAAIHAGRRKVDTVLIGHPEKSALFGADVENYFGVPYIEGKDLIANGIKQAESFDAEIIQQDVVELNKEEEEFVIVTDHDLEIRAKSIILAPGVSRERLGIEGEKEYEGRGVSYCASCDCNFFNDKDVAVIGDGSVAASAALLLRDYASKVYWLVDELDVAEPLKKKIDEGDIDLRTSVTTKRILGENLVTGIELEDGTRIDVEGVFIELGAKSSTELALDIDLIPDPDGHIPVDSECMTEMEGVYASGDVTGHPWQLAKAVGQGCIAGTNAAKWIKEIRK